jgi:hypothetical protein
MQQKISKQAVSTAMHQSQLGQRACSSWLHTACAGQALIPGKCMAGSYGALAELAQQQQLASISASIFCYTVHAHICTHSG